MGGAGCAQGPWLQNGPLMRPTSGGSQPLLSSLTSAIHSCFGSDTKAQAAPDAKRRNLGRSGRSGPLKQMPAFGASGRSATAAVGQKHQPFSRYSLANLGRPRAGQPPPKRVSFQEIESRLKLRATFVEFRHLRPQDFGGQLREFAPARYWSEAAPAGSRRERVFAQPGGLPQKASAETRGLGRRGRPYPQTKQLIAQSR